MRTLSYFKCLLLASMLLVFVPHVVSTDYKYFSLPDGAKMRLGKGTIHDFAYSPDSIHLAVASSIGIWLYDVQTGEEIKLLTDEKHGAVSVVYSPDGTSIVSVCSDGKTRMWDTTTGKLKTTLNWDIDGTSQDNIVVYSDDGSTLAIGGNYRITGTRTTLGVLRLWDASTENLKVTLRSDKRAFDSVAFSPDNTTLVSKHSHSEVAQLWNVNSGKLIATLTHNRNIYSLMYSPDSSILATLGTDKQVCLWNTTTGKLENTLKHNYQVPSAAYSPDGTTIATASVDQNVRIWDASSGELITTLIEYTDWVTDARYSPDGKTIASASRDNTLRLWNSSTGELKNTLNHSNKVRSFMYSQDGDIILSRCYNETLYFWDTSTARPISTIKLSDENHTFKYSLDGKTLTSWSKDNIVRIWDVNTGKLMSTLTEHNDGVYSLAYSPDGTTIATGTADRKVNLWDAATGNLKTTLTGHTDRLHSLLYSPDGTTLASWGYDYSMLLWDVITGDLKVRIKPGHWASSMAYSLDSTTITTALGDKTLRSWDTSSGKLKNTLFGHTGQVAFVAYSPDGTIIVSGSWRDRTVHLWHATNGKPISQFRHPDDLYVFVDSQNDITVAHKDKDKRVHLLEAFTGKHKVTLAGKQDYDVAHFTYSPNATTVACLSKEETLIVWDALTGRIKALVRRGKTRGVEYAHTGHAYWRYPYIYSPDSTTIAGGYNNSVRLWDVNSGKTKATLRHTDWVYGFAFSPDGTLIATGGRDGTVLLWDLKQIVDSE